MECENRVGTVNKVRVLEGTQAERVQMQFFSGVNEPRPLPNSNSNDPRKPSFHSVNVHVKGHSGTREIL